MTVAARLEKVEGRLTPKQAMRLWRQEAHAYPSLLAYAGWLKQQPMSAYPLVKLPEQVARAVKEATRGQERRQQDRALFEARREVAFLFKLVIAANEQWYGQERAFDFGYLLLLEKAWHLKEYLDASDEGRPLPSYFDDHAAVWRVLADGLLRQLLVLRDALDQLGARYLDGDPLLFPDGQAALQKVLDDLCHLIWLHNEDVVGRLPKAKRKALLAPTADDLSPQLAGVAAAERDRVADLARAETLRLMGDYVQAAELMAQWMP